MPYGRRSRGVTALRSTPSFRLAWLGLRRSLRSRPRLRSRHRVLAHRLAHVDQHPLPPARPPALANDERAGGVVVAARPLLRSSGPGASGDRLHARARPNVSGALRGTCQRRPPALRRWRGPRCAANASTRTPRPPPGHGLGILAKPVRARRWPGGRRAPARRGPARRLTGRVRRARAVGPAAPARPGARTKSDNQGLGEPINGTYV